MEQKIDSIAEINGGTIYPEIHGFVYFKEIEDGTEVYINISGLPKFSRDKNLNIAPFGFHIHDGKSCDKGTDDNPFPKSGMHYNPDNQPHGNHAGDFPVIFSNSGISKMCFFTDRFKPIDIIDKTVIIHQSPDDYISQPSGNTGKKIACGVIKEFEMQV